MNARRIGLIVGGLAATVVLFFVLRPADEDGATPAPATTATLTRTVETSVEPPAPPPPATRPPVPTVRIAIRGGELVGGLQQITVKRGGTVRLVVTSDVSDHVHVHGIDVFQDVAPGKPARFTLKPTIAGRYEIELEDRGFLIAQLNVTQ
jgi:hypothetical protein